MGGWRAQRVRGQAELRHGELPLRVGLEAVRRRLQREPARAVRDNVLIRCKKVELESEQFVACGLNIEIENVVVAGGEFLTLINFFWF